MDLDEQYIQRCIDLAKKGENNVKSNPHVGAVIVHKGSIIGEGYHKQYGRDHAEVDALKSVNPSDTHLLKDSTMYVSLEPCNHFGKTPPCVNAIIESGIKKVVIGSEDPSPSMKGKSVEILRENGVDVKMGVLANQTNLLLRRFEANRNGLPFVVIKYAQSKDFFIGKKDEQVAISGDGTSIFTHRLRALNEAIFVGTNTAIVDDPSLTTRNYPGDSPLRIVLDRHESIPKAHLLINDELPTLIFTLKENYKVKRDNKSVETLDDWDLEGLLRSIYQRGIHSLLVEGGAKVIKWFVKEELWHDAFIITSQDTILNEGVRAPTLKGKLLKSWIIQKDQISHVVNIFDKRLKKI